MLIEQFSVLRVRSGLYRIVGFACSCGGELRVERCGSSREFLWETFCVKCKTCDCDGWSTLADCVENAREYFGATPDVPTL